jgi:predicted RNase H-like HicB family nuclease
MYTQHICHGSGLLLRDYLSVPYMLESETTEASPGSWCSGVSYPELPGCLAETAVVADALQRLEQLRIEMIVAMFVAGRFPPVPRPPLRDCDPVWAAKAAGLPNDLIALIAADGPAGLGKTKRQLR